MADWWADLENFFNWEQVAAGDRAIVAAIQALGQQLSAATAAASGTASAAGTAGAAGAGSSASGTTASEPAWVVGPNATAISVPIVVRPSGQQLSVPAELAATLTGGTVTFLTGNVAGQSAQIASVSTTGVLTLSSGLPVAPAAGDQVAFIGAMGSRAPGATALAPLRTHLPIPTFWTIGTTAVAITVSTYTTALPASVELWNRGSTDLYVNFNGIEATGDTATSTDMHLAASETWSGNVQVTALSVLSSASDGLFEVQCWGP